jgi:drug/metabolite transporter (DMT)-like permease
MLLVALMLWGVTLTLAPWGGWRSLPPQSWWPLALSGLVGIFVGDVALFAAMNRLGPRRAGVLFATHAAFSAVLGFVVLGERIGLQAALGGVLTLVGVMTAILLGRRQDDDHAWEADSGHVGAGVLLALLAALCTALASLIVKPVMITPGVDPIAASAVRVSVATVAQFVLLASGFAAARPTQRPTLSVLVQTGVNGFVAMGLGTTLVLVALKNGDVGTVAILSSVSPVLLLPLLWLRLGRPPAPAAWLGAGLTVVGTGLILLR